MINLNRNQFVVYLFFCFICLVGSKNLSAQFHYNPLWIPDTLSGTTFNLDINEYFDSLRPGQRTLVGGINGRFWGPTLFLKKGDVVNMNVRNGLNDSTTIHWHGMHLPAVMDGGPHQIIPPGTTWRPYWEVKNNAATYWYHPHLHEMTMEQITKGVGGLIIVRDSIEASLNLPRKYGVDDIPLVLTDRDIDNTNQFVVVPYGDSMLVNGTLSPQCTVPAQVVRFRILNAAIERSYNLGFSDNRAFSVITSDGGLLNQPVSVTRYLLSAGERIEILVNFSTQSNTSIDLKAYNSTLANFIPGGESFPNGPFANALGKKDFRVLHINVGAATSNGVTTIPTTLTTNVFPSSTSSNLTRTITLTDSAVSSGVLGPNMFLLGRKPFNINYINHVVPLNNTEIWELKSTSGFAHPFHIHDVEFYILTRNGVAPPTYEQGWKDVVLVKNNETVRFIAKFDDFADSLHPFMYHCHISLHEDEGMMGQFVVKGSSTLPLDILSFNAQKKQNNTVALSWTTTNQINVKYCIVERSSNGNFWSAIDTVPPSLSGSIHNYTAIDEMPLYGANYYRIKFVDIDDRMNYSAVKLIQKKSEQFDFTVFPIPAKNKLYFNFDDPAHEVYYMKVLDQIGRTIYMLPRPQLQSGLDIDKLKPGNYYLQVTDAKTKVVVTKKFTKSF